ncbi:MAG: hypothetical protein ACJ72N_21985 [Labedaea sp.]
MTAPGYRGVGALAEGGGPLALGTKIVSFAGAGDGEATLIPHNESRRRVYLRNLGPAAVVVGQSRGAAGASPLTTTSGFHLRPFEPPTVLETSDGLAALPLGPALVEILEEALDVTSPGGVVTAAAGGTPIVEGAPLWSVTHQQMAGGGFIDFTSPFVWVGDHDVVWLVFENPSSASSRGWKITATFGHSLTGGLGAQQLAGAVITRTWTIQAAHSLAVPLAVYGPLCQLTIKQDANPGAFFDAALYPVRGGRRPPAGSPFTVSAMIDLGAGASCPVGTTSFFAGYPFAGPAFFWAASTGAAAGSLVTLWGVDYNGNAKAIDQWQASVAAYQTPRQVFVPPGIVRADVFNNGAVAQTFFVSLMPLWEGGG